MASFMRVFFISSLIWTLAFPCSIFANTPVYDDEEIKIIVDNYSENLSTLKDMIKKVSATNAIKAKELEDFFKSEGVNLDTVAPKLIYKDQILTLNSNGQNVHLEFSNKDAIKVSYAKKSVFLNSSMSLVSMKTELVKLFDGKVSYSVLDFLISKAHAELVILTVILLAAAGATLLFSTLVIMDSIFRTRAMNQAAKRVHEMCNRLENSTPAELALTKDVLESYNSIAFKYSYYCRDSNSSSNPCKHVKEARECLKNSIQRSLSSNDSNRSGKKIEYDTKKDEYKAVSVAK
jgi:hypothetical protein